MSPRIMSIRLAEKLGFDVFMTKRASTHQPIHLLIVHGNNDIRVKVYSDSDELEYEYGSNSSLKAKDERQFEGWVARNIEDIEYDWDIICGRIVGEYRVGLE